MRSLSENHISFVTVYKEREDELDLTAWRSVYRIPSPVSALFDKSNLVIHQN